MSFPPVIKRLNELNIALGNNGTALTTHANNKNNPHAVTAAQVGAYNKTEIDGMLGDLGGGGLTEMTIITTSGTWTAPNDGVFLFIVVGAGGAAGNTRTAAGGSGGGGAGGGGGVRFFSAKLQAGQTISIVIGAGGIASGSAGLAGKGGGETKVTVGALIVTAGGGGGGGGGAANVVSENAAGGGGGGGGSDAGAEGAAGSGTLGGAGGAGGGRDGGKGGALASAGGQGVATTGGAAGSISDTAGALGGRPYHGLPGSYGFGGDGSTRVVSTGPLLGKAGNSGCVAIFY